VKQGPGLFEEIKMKKKDGFSQKGQRLLSIKENLCGLEKGESSQFKRRKDVCRVQEKESRQKGGKKGQPLPRSTQSKDLFLLKRGKRGRRRRDRIKLWGEYYPPRV